MGFYRPSPALRPLIGALLLGLTLALGLLGLPSPGLGTAQLHAQHDHQSHEDPDSPEATLYTCGMHPEVIQEGPGTCPICGMDLTPMMPRSGGSPSTLTIDPVTVQNMGMRVAEVSRGEVWRSIRILGEVLAPEHRVAVVNLRVSGWIEAIYADKTGQAIKAGEPLFRLYSPEVIAAQEEYVLALASGGENSRLAKAGLRRLKLMGLPAWHLKELARHRDGQRTVTFPSPATGVVLHKNVQAGARVSAGQDLYQIADLGEVWIEGQVYQFDGPLVAVGQEATIEVPSDPASTLSAPIEYIYPLLDPRTRSLTIRFTLPNPQGALMPGMFATVSIKAAPREGLRVPSESILRSGSSTSIFVSTSPGHYEGREVRIGMVGDNGYTEILEGVAEGETVVTSGQFLLDSESQLQEALEKMLTRRLQIQPEAGAESKKMLPHEEAGPYRCPLHPSVIEESEPGICPIDGLELAPAPGAQR